MLSFSFLLSVFIRSKRPAAECMYVSSVQPRKGRQLPGTAAGPFSDLGFSPVQWAMRVPAARTQHRQATVPPSGRREKEEERRKKEKEKGISDQSDQEIPKRLPRRPQEARARLLGGAWGALGGP